MHFHVVSDSSADGHQHLHPVSLLLLACHAHICICLSKHHHPCLPARITRDGWRTVVVFVLFSRGFITPSNIYSRAARSLVYTRRARTQREHCALAAGPERAQLRGRTLVWVSSLWSAASLSSHRALQKTAITRNTCASARATVRCFLRAPNKQDILIVRSEKSVPVKDEKPSRVWFGLL